MIKIKKLPVRWLVIILIGIIVSILISNYLTTQHQTITNLQSSQKELLARSETARVELEELKNQDQYKINKKLQENIENIKKTYSLAVDTYENLLKLKESLKDTEELDELYAEALSFLSETNYVSASASLSELSEKIKKEQDKIAAAQKIPETIPAQNSPPGSGYSRQRVTTDAGTFLVDIIAADLSSTKVIVDTASDSDCSNDCPVLSLADYVSRNGAYAGVNGSYFCPATYPSCANKKNTFDTLLMNKNKVYFNSDNNVYSTVPAVIFGNGWVRFVSQSLQWGRDASVDSVIANHPLLVADGNLVFGGDSDPKKGSKGRRSFVSNKGNTVYIGVVHNATVAESGRVLHTLGMENALNLDDGGSTALWSGNYKVGPGRNLPNVVLFVRK